MRVAPGFSASSLEPSAGCEARRRLDDSRAALALAERVGDPALVAAVIARVAQAESWAADFTPGLVERGVEIEDRLGLGTRLPCEPAGLPAAVADAPGEIERPRALLEELERNAAARGDEGTRALTLWYLSHTGVARRPLAGRARHMDEAEELAAQIMFAWASGWTGRVRALVEADLGLVEAARESADVGLTGARRDSNEIFMYLIARACAAGSSSRSGTWRPRAATCASCPENCSSAA